VLGRIVVGVLLLLGGTLALLDLLGVLRFTFERFLELSLVLCGAGLIVGAWRGRARGLIALGLLLLPALAAVNLLALADARGGVGERTVRPDRLADVREEYRLFAGATTIDLSDVDFGAEPAEVRATVTFGDVTVVVPRGTHVEVEGSVRAGTLDLLDHVVDGTDLSRTVVGPGDEQGGRLRLRLEVGVGAVTVDRAPPEEVS
jgi:hypothetical protein